MTTPIRVTVWNENLHEQRDEPVRRIYPDGMHGAIADGLRERLGERVQVRCATLAESEHGLQDDVLVQTDVLTWWGHAAHGQVADDVVERVERHVLEGMGLVVLHSAHMSKIFRRLMGTPCTLHWRRTTEGERELLWTVAPGHPIARGVPHPVVIPHHEMYGEFFAIPEPDQLVFVSSFEGGEVFRSGCCFRRGAGRIAYFSPGDQDFPVYHQPEIQQVLANCVAWADGGRMRVRISPQPARVDAGWFMAAGE